MAIVFYNNHAKSCTNIQEIINHHFRMLVYRMGLVPPLEVAESSSCCCIGLWCIYY
jgi:hypothetical protein